MERDQVMNHFLFYVSPDQYETVVSWYLAALAPLNFAKIMDFGKVCGMGVEGKQPEFWIAQKESPGTSDFHVAFTAKDHAAVDAFHAAGVKAGGKDNGAPGFRQMYHPNYYAAFVIDPVGNNIEVVDHSAH